MSKTSAGIRTISLRIAGTEEARNEIADLGEDIDDYVVRTKSKTDQIIRDYTAVASNNYKGVSVLDDNGNLRDTYDILLDIAKVYKEIQETDKKAGTNRANALVETLAGKNRSNIAASILQNPELLEQAYTASQHSEGVGQKELDIYLDSVAAKMETLQNHLQELASVTIDSEWLKDLVDLGSGAVKTVTGLTKAFGGLNTIIGAIAGILLQKSGFGLFSFDKLSGQWTSFIGKVKTSRKILQETKTGINNWMANQGLSEDTQLSAIISADNPLGIGKQLDVIGMNAGLRDYIKNLDEATRSSITLGQAIQGYYNSMSIGTKIAKGFSNVLHTIGSTVGTMFIMMAASKAISAIFTGISDAIITREESIKAGKEADSKASSSRSEIQKIDSAVKVAQDRYNKLRKGVYMNGNTIQNLSLSADEYTEFLDINQQLGEVFPGLITGINDAGQALVDLGGDADAATQKLTGFSDAAKQIYINDIEEQMPKIVSGLLEQNESFDKSIEESEKQLNSYQKVLDTISDINGSGDYSVTIGDKEARESLEQYLSNSGIYYDASVLGTVDFSLSHEDYMRFKKSKEGYENQAYGNIQRVQNIIDSAEKERQNNWNKEFVPNLTKILEADPNFLKMGDEMTNLITSKLPEFDWNSFFSSDVVDYYDSEDPIAIAQQIIEPIELALSEGKVDPIDIGKVLNFDWGNATNEEITDTTSKVLETLFPNEEIRQQVAVAFDIMYEDENGLHYTVTKERNDFYEMFGGKVTGYDPKTGKYTRDDSNARISWNDIMKVGKEDRDFILGQADQGLVNLDTIKNYDELIAKIQELRQTQAEVGTQTLADVLKDEAFSDSASNIESRITALKTAMDSLMETGELKGDGLADLLEAVPEFKQLGEELTDDDISNAMVENIHEWAKLFDETVNSKDLSDDAKKAAQNYKKAVIQGFLEDTPVTTAQAQKSIQDLFGGLVDLSGEPSEAIEKKYAHQITRANEVFEALQEEFGKDFDANVVEMIVDADPSMATATTEQWIATYKDYQVELKLTVNAKELEQIESKIENLGSERGMLQSRISASESIGGIGSQADYDRIAEIDQETVGLNEDKVRNLSQKYQQMILGGRARGLMDNEDFLTTLRGVENELLTAQGDLAESYGQEAESRKDQITYSARKFQNEIDKRSELISSLEGVSERYTNEGKIMDHATAQSIVDAENANRQSYYNMAKEYEALARNPENAVWATEFQAAAISARITAQNMQRRTAEDLIDESRINFLDNSLQSLEATATTIQDAITLQEGQGLKPTIDQYQRLVKNGQDQVDNLEKQNYYLSRQQNRLTVNSARWREIGAQINSNNSAIASMNGNINSWQDNLRSFAGDMGQSLLSALQAAFDESNSPTGLQFSTMKELAAQFEGIEGFDFADIFYNTAQGVKLDADATERLVDAQYQLMTGDLTKRINSQNAALQNLRQTYRETTDASEKANLSMQIDAGEANLNNLYNQMAQYQALYSQAQRQLFSDYGAWQRAQSSENAGATYSSIQGYLATQEQAYKDGLTGTDEFKTYTTLFDQWGRDTLKAYTENREKMKRYLTEDATGVANVLTDLVETGFASYDEDTMAYSFDISDMKKAASSIGVSKEFLDYALQRTEDYGFTNDYVRDQIQGELKLSDLVQQTGEAIKKRNELIAEGAPQEVIDEYNEKIAQLDQSTENVEKNIQTVVANSGKISASEVKAAVDTINEYKKRANEATTDQQREAYMRQIQNVADEAGIELDELGGIDYKKLNKQYAGWYKEKDAKAVSDITDEQVESVKLEDESLKNNEAIQAGLGKIKDNWEANKDSVQDYVDILKGANVDDLMGLDLNDKKTVAGLEKEENALDALAAAFGLAGDEANALMPFLKEIGLFGEDKMYNKPGAQGTLGVDVGAAQNYLEAHSAIGLTADDLVFDAANMSLDELQSKMDQLSQAKGMVRIEEQGGPEALAQLEQLEAECQKEYNIKVGMQNMSEMGMTIDEFLGKTKDEQIEIMAKLGIEEENYDAFVARIESNPIRAKIETALSDGSKSVEDLIGLTDEELIAEVGCEASEVDEVRAELEEMAANEYDVKVAINDASIAEIGKSIAAALNGQEYKKDVTLEAKGQDKVQSEAEKPATKKVNIVYEVVQKAKNFVGGVVGAVSNFFGGSRQTVSASLNTNAATTALNALKAEASNIPVTINASSAEATLNELSQGIETVRTNAGEPIELTVNADSAIESVNSLQEAIEEAKSAASGPIEVSADVKGKAEVDALRNAIEKTNGKTIPISVSGVSNSILEVRKLGQVIQGVAGKTVNIGVSGVGNALLAIGNLKRQIASLTGKTITITTVRRTVQQTVGNKVYGTLSSIGHGYAKGTFDEDGKVKKSGTAYNMLNYKDMSGYAKGDIAIDKDQESLINELGTESLINFFVKIYGDI